MKNLLLKFTAIVLILISVASSCNPEPEKEVYPKDVTFTEYSLQETSCQWANLPYDEKVLIINSNEELSKYILCEEGSSYPAIDFTKQSLLLASGISDREVNLITVKKMKQLSADAYKLNIEIALKFTNIYGQFFEYNTALLVEKMSDEGVVALNITLNEPKMIRPITVTDEETFDFFYWKLPKYPSSDDPRCFFTTTDWEADTCFMINSMEELQQAYVCTDELPEIDFNAYTLIIGKRWSNHTGFLVANQFIVEDNVITFYLQCRKYDDYYGYNFLQYYWGLYPKLPNKPFYIEYYFAWK